MKTRIVGDIHGKVASYQNIVKDAEQSIQVGDFGVGFFGKEREKNLIDWQNQNPKHKFIRGNHDDPQKCKDMPNYIDDGIVQDDIMFVGGAWSIDRRMRVEGIDWWPDEECSMEQLQHFIDVYNMIKPRIMITHDCPESVSYQLFIASGNSIAGNTQFKTRTAQAFQAMFDVHKPDLWVFGHWHMDVDQYIKNTRFICLNELSYIDVDMETLDVMKQKSFGQPRMKF